MTRAEALAEARRRWGAMEGEVRYVRLYREYRVGKIAPVIGSEGKTITGFWAKGHGKSYEAAFADAERREACRRSPVAGESPRDKADRRAGGAK